jgi:hypothetical protein
VAKFLEMFDPTTDEARVCFRVTVLAALSLIEQFFVSDSFFLNLLKFSAENSAENQFSGFFLQTLLGPML